MDKGSLKKAEEAHPLIKQDLIIGINRCNKALTGRSQVMLVYVFRSDELQNELYALGRTKVNPDGKSKDRPMGYKVTNAKGGESIHQFRLAFDICLLIDGNKSSWDDVKDFDGDGKADWMECVKIFEELGFEWGGRWSSFIDKPHFQKTFGRSTKQLRALRDQKNFIAGTSYINLTISPSNKFEVLTGLNLRSNHSTEGAVIMVIPKGTNVVELKRMEGWSEIEFGSKRGWVSNKYLTKI